MRRCTTSARELKRLQRREEVYGLRVAGRSIPYIAQHLQIGLATVKRDIDATMAAARGRMADRAQTEFMLTLERLDQYQTAVHEKAKEGDQQAVETCLKIEAQRAKLLHPTSGSLTAVNVNVDKSDGRLRAETHGITVRFVTPDGSKCDDPVPPPLPGYGPRPIGAAEMDDARRVTHPHLVEHQMPEYGFRDKDEPQVEPPPSVNGQPVQNGAVDGWGSRKQWKRLW